MDMTLVLPWPPSVNSYYRSVNKGALAGRVLISQAGRDYRRAVEDLIGRRGLDTLTGRLAVEIEAFPPDRRRRDLDNLLKGLLDSLVHSQAILDDHLIDELTIRRGPICKGGRVTVHLTTIEDDEEEC